MYFFVPVKDKAICLICRGSLSNFKSYNIKRYFDQKHDEIKQLTIGERKVKLQLLKTSLIAEQNVFQKQAAQLNAIVYASMRISHVIGKKMKPFSGGEYIKECLMAAVEEIAPDKIKAFTQINLSHQTVTRRINDISTEISLTLNGEKFVCFSLALDETIDIKNTAQFSIFIRGVDKQMNVTEEFLDLVSLKDTTSGNDIKDASIKSVQDYQLDLKI